MQLIPQQFEYLFLLAVYLLILVVLFGEEIAVLARSRSFWISGCLFALCWTVIEIFGLRQEIWVYSEERLCGLALFTVPLEEYIVFFLIHLSAVSAWQRFGARPEGASR